MQTYPTPAPVTTVLDIPAGRIRLIATDRTDTAVEVLPADAAKARDRRAAEQVKVSCADGVLRIETPAPANPVLGHSGSVEVTIQLPAGSRVQAKAAGAELRGVGRLGEVAFEAAQATVELDEAATAHLALLAGDITLHRLTGPARLTTKKGDIRIAEATTGTVELRTDYGDISVGAARGVSAALNAGTAYGRVHNALTNTGTADLAIHATTAHGDITARSL